MKKLRMMVEQGLGCVVAVAILGMGSVTLLAMNRKPQQSTMDAPPALKATHKAALLVLNKGENTLAIVDPTTLTVMAKVGTGPVAHEVAASSDGALAFVTNYGAHQDGTTLSVIDLRAYKEIHRVDLGDLRGPHGVVSFGGKAWFTVEGSKKIARYDPVTNTVDWTQEIGQNRTHILLITRDGRRIYTTNVESDSVSILDRSPDGKSWTSTVVAVGKGPEGMDLSPDGTQLWVANSHVGTVSIVDTTAKKVTETVDVETKHSNRLKFTMNGKLVLISDLGSGELLVVDVETRKEVKRLKLGTSVEGILIAPDGTRAFVAVSGDNKVAVVDLKTLEVTKTFTTGQEPDGMAWAK